VEISNLRDKEAIKRSIEVLQPLDLNAAAAVLKETKRILDELGITFFLRKGTCLGAVRDKELIPWDDDLDIGSLAGYHGLTEKLIGRAVSAFKGNGFMVNVTRQSHGIYVILLKESIRIDWVCQWIIDGSTYHWPGVRIPAELFTDVREIGFLDEKFNVPNPVEEYLAYMYGTEWRVPKKAGSYEKDVLGQVPQNSTLTRSEKLKQLITRYLLPWRITRIRVFNLDDKPVSDARIVVVRLGEYNTNHRGYIKLYVPQDDIYSLIIRYGDHEEVLYEENIHRGETYIYRPDTNSASGRYFILSTV